MPLRINKTTLRVLLIMVALSVWFHNGYKFFIGVQKSDEVTVEKSRLDDELAEPDSARLETGWTYDASLRDPFQNWLLKPKPVQPSKAVHRTKPQPAPKPPQLRLQGIIQDGNGILAILENNSETRFVRAGDNVFDIKIVAIDSTVLSYEFNKAQFVLNLK